MFTNLEEVDTDVLQKGLDKLYEIIKSHKLNTTVSMIVEIELELEKRSNI